jgi:hypothetical protein
MTTTTGWRPVPGYEGAYAINKRGDVLSLRRVVKRSNGASHTVRERVLVPAVQRPRGRARVTLSAQGRRRRMYVHRLVAEAFPP